MRGDALGGFLNKIRTAATRTVREVCRSRQTFTPQTPQKLSRHFYQQTGGIGSDFYSAETNGR